MSGPNTMHMRERDDTLPIAEAPATAQPVNHPGLALELGTIYDDLRLALADAKLAYSQDNLAALEAHATKIASLSAHAARTVTALRSSERTRHQTKE